MSAMPTHLQHVVESLCNDGCKTVRLYITQLEHGESLNQVNSLNSQERTQVLNELKAIMAVYDRCQG